MGGGDDLVLGVGQNHVAVLAHDLDVEVPLGRVAGAGAKLKVDGPLPGGHGGDRHQRQLVDLVLDLLAKGKGVLPLGGGIA